MKNFCFWDYLLILIMMFTITHEKFTINNINNNDNQSPIFFDFSIVNQTTFTASFEIHQSSLPCWVAVGFSDNYNNFNLSVTLNKTMRFVDIWAAEFIDNNTAYLNDMYLNSYSYPFNDTDIGGTYDFQNVDYSNSTNDLDYNVLKFERNLNTSDLYDFVFQLPNIYDQIYTMDLTNVNLSNSTFGNNSYDSTTILLLTKYNITLIFAWGSGKKLNNHKNNLSYAFLTLFNNNTVLIQNYNEQSNPDSYFFVSGITFSFIWIFLNFIGVYFSTYMKHNPNWIYFHVIFSGGSSLITIIYGLNLYQYLYYYNFNSEISAVIHIQLIPYILGSIFYQILFGILNYFILHKFNPETGFIFNLKRIHKYSGYLIILSIYLMALTGIHTEHTYLGMIFTMYFLVIGSLVLFYFIKRDNRIKNINRIESIIEANDERREKIFFFSREDIHDLKKMKKIVFYDNFIVDVETFIETHPGGKIHLLNNLGSDVSRYLCGSMSINKNFNPHYHSLSAHKYLISNMVLGIFRENSGIIITTDSKDAVITQNVDSELIEVQFFDLAVVWKSSRIINMYVSEIRFTLKRNLQNFRFNRFLPGYRWAGRHYSVSSKKINKNRIYSVCLVLDETLYNYHRLLIDNLGKLQIKEKIIPPQIKKNELINDYLQIYIKKYNYPNALSKYIHEFSSKSEEDDIFAKGPIGLGLDLEPKLEGVYIMFGGGTGVLCFLDFIAYILRYIADKVAVNEYGVKNNRISLDEDFSPIAPNFKLIYFSAFKDKFSTIFQELSEKMNFFCEKYSFINSVFKYYNRIAKNFPQKWDKNFLKQELEIYKDEITKVYICGPSDFLEDIQYQFLGTGLVEKNKIILI